MTEVPAGRDDDNDEGKRRQKIDLSGIVTPLTDFPAHCDVLHGRRRTNTAPKLRFPAYQPCAF
jgi:hypothetical protein